MHTTDHRSAVSYTIMHQVLACQKLGHFKWQTFFYWTAMETAQHDSTVPTSIPDGSTLAV